MMDLDHVAVVVADLDAGQAAFARLGFRLSPRSSHRGPVPGQGVRDWGSGNHCAMFRQGYFEVLGITDPDGYKPHLDRRLGRYAGLHLIGFGTSDAAAEVAALRARGVVIEDPQQLGRDVPYGAGTRPGSFQIANLDPGTYSEADFIVIEQETRDVLWQPSLLDQPNGVVSLERVTVASRDPEATCARLEPVLGPQEGGRFALSPGVMEVVGADALAARLPGCKPPGDFPCGVAVAFGVADMDRTRAYLADAGVPLILDEADILRVSPDFACGCVVEFIKIGERA